MTGQCETALIVNADDFGYFDRVSAGILSCARAGVVTATGVMANGPALASHAPSLAKLPNCSVGVHLNATLGRPLTERMQQSVERFGGQFPGKFALIANVIAGRIGIPVLVDEWRAQILRVHEMGLKPTFLNSHEHVHVFPALFGKVASLAAEFGIRYIRMPRHERLAGQSRDALFRNLAIRGLEVTLKGSRRREPILLGMGVSGRLDTDYCRKRFPTLQRGAVYELMCHPGFSDPEAQDDARLARYHDWELERRTLMGAEFKELLRLNRIQLISYDELSVRGWGA